MKTAKIGYYFNQFNENVTDTCYFMEYDYDEKETPLYKMHHTFAHLMFQHLYKEFVVSDWISSSLEATLVINGRTIGKYECALEVKPSFMVNKKK